MKGLSESIPVELPKPQSLKEKLQSWVHAIGGNWYTGKKQEAFTPKVTKTKQKSRRKILQNKNKSTNKKSK